MIKIPTLFRKDPNNLALVINEINPACQWVFDGEGIATQKFDGTAAAVIDGALYKRYDVKKGRKVPANAIPCQEPDAVTGHWPHWVKCELTNPEDQYFIEGMRNMVDAEMPKAKMITEGMFNGTYELCGPKVQGNPEKLSKHQLIKHGSRVIGIKENYPLTFETLKKYLGVVDIEGIVFHHKTDGRMCKIRKSDFGIKR